MLTNLCEHFNCPHYSVKTSCSRYLVAGHCPVNEVKGIVSSQYFLSVDLKQTNENGRDLIRHGISMTGIEMDEKY